LIAACAHFVEQLLERCCLDLRILATSREPLGVPGEVTWRVPSLSLPPGESPAGDVAAVAQSEAVRLFVERARAAAPGFALQPGNADAIAQICRRLDGMPLAIELAAARVNVLTVEQIAERLDDRFHLLRTNIRNAPARQQTLEATIDWSYALLSSEEKVLLRRLSVFAGGADLASVEAICADEAVGRASILDLISHLVDKSLVLSVVRDPDHEARYQLLETIRQYAGERLAAACETGALRERHLAHYMRLAEQAEPEMYRPNVVAWLDRLDAEHDNFREALSWAIDQAEHGQDTAIGARTAHSALQLVVLLDPFWRIRSHLNEARMWLQKVLGLSLAQGASPERARALAGAARFAWMFDDMAPAWAACDESISIGRALGSGGRAGLGDALRLAGNMWSSYGYAAAARPLLEESLTLYQQTDDSLGAAYALRELGTLAMMSEDWPAARGLLDRGLATFRATGDIWGTARMLGTAARVAYCERDYASARRLYEAALAADEKLGFSPGIAFTRAELGHVMRLEGDLDLAQAYQDEALALFRKIGQGTANQTVEFGCLALARGDIQEAARRFRYAVTEFSALGDNPGIVACLTGLAEVSSLRGDPRRAAQLLGVAEARLERTGAQRAWIHLPDYERAIKAVREALDAVTLAAEWAAGRAQESLEAIDAIPDEPKRVAGPPSTPPATAPAYPLLRTLKAQWGGLTAREREVAALVAHGKPNRQIAEDLVVSERTVEAHIGNILAKLELTSRTQIATWAIGKGLVQVR
jgi:predicted ATPase/DNA-binding CsgD family transcriptional regulator